MTVTFCGADRRERFAVFYDGGPDAVMLLHGMRSDHREFADFPLQLSKAGFTVLALDFAGCGKSGGTPGYLSPQLLLDDVGEALTFLSDCGVARVAVLGHSFGIHAALSSIVKYSEIVAAIIVAPQLRSGASLTGVKHLLFRAMSFLRPFSGAFKFINIRSKKNYDALFVDPEARDWAQRIDWDPGVYNLGALGHATGMDNAALLMKITKPVLAVIGAQDEKTLPKRSLELIERMPDDCIRTLILENSGHSPFADNDKHQLLLAVCAFLSDVFAAKPEEDAS